MDKRGSYIQNLAVNTKNIQEGGSKAGHKFQNNTEEKG